MSSQGKKGKKGKDDAKPKETGNSGDVKTEDDKPKKLSGMARARKNVSERMVTSRLGKKAVKKKLDPSVRALIKSLKHIIQVDTNSKETAQQMEHNVMKVLTKSYFLISNEIVPIAEFRKAEEPMTKALRLIIKVYDHLDSVPEHLRAQTLEQKFYILAVLFEQSQLALVNLLTPHLKPKSIQLIDKIFKHVANHEFFHRVWSNDGLKSHVEVCMDSLRKLAPPPSRRH